MKLRAAGARKNARETMHVEWLREAERLDMVLARSLAHANWPLDEDEAMANLAPPVPTTNTNLIPLGPAPEPEPVVEAQVEEAAPVEAAEPDTFDRKYVEDLRRREM